MRTKDQPYLKWAEKHLDIVNITGDEAMVRCFVHDDSKASCQFNLVTGLWVCFACSAGGNIRKACNELGVPVAAEPIPDLDDIYAALAALEVPPVKKAKPLSESTLRRYSIPTAYWGPCPARCKDKEAKSCHHHRRFDKKTIKAFGLGFDVMEDAAIIPMRNQHGELIGVTRRFLGDDVILRYRYPKGFKRKNNLFASWMVEHADTDFVVLTEGAVDAMKLWQAGIPAMAIYGSSISPYQVRLLRRLGIGTVILMFDNDKAGKKATRNCQGWKEHKRKKKTVYEYDPSIDLRLGFLVKVVKYKIGDSDPGDMDVKTIRKRVKNARLINLGKEVA